MNFSKDFTKDKIISKVCVFGIRDAIEASKYAKAVDTEAVNDRLTETVKKLGSAPVGSGHDCFLKGIHVSFNLTFTIKAWTEAERYHFFEIVTSQSTMHRINQFDIEKSCVEYVDREIINRVELLKKKYNYLCKIKKATEEDFYRLIYSVPVGFRLTARLSTNYLQLKNMYFQRRNHRLPEWKVFCEWVESLPMFKELILGE